MTDSTNTMILRGYRLAIGVGWLAAALEALSLCAFTPATTLNENATQAHTTN
jgi:hypothetical protein